MCERGRMSHIQNFPLQSKFPEWKPFNVKLKWGEKVVLTLCPVSAMISNENHPLNRIKQHNLELISQALVPAGTWYSAHSYCEIQDQMKQYWQSNTKAL